MGSSWIAGYGRRRRDWTPSWRTKTRRPPSLRDGKRSGEALSLQIRRGPNRPPAPNQRELRRFASLIEKRAGVVAPKPWMDSLLSATACGGRDNTVGFDAGDYSVKVGGDADG